LRWLIIGREEATKFKTLSTSSPEYFNFLLDIVSKHDLKFQPDTENWRLDLMEGYVTSADTGSEDLVRASRAAIAQLCQRGKTSTDVVCSCLSSIMKSNVGNDRVLVPAMEVLSFLFDVGIMSKMSPEG
jgi:tubulin-specific chaperone D